MKIALLGSKDFDSLEYHLSDSFRFLGHDVFHIDIKDVIKIPYRYNYWASKLLPKYDKMMFNTIASRIIEQAPELVIGTYRFINPECIRKIKKELPNTTIIHINPDQLTTLEHQQIFASPYDAYFTKDHYMVDFMKNKMNLNTFYLPEALNARLHIPPAGIDKKQLEEKINIDVVAFGTMYPYRAKMVSELIKNDINVSLFGVPDKRFPREEITNNFKNEFITGTRKAEILFGSKIIFNNFHYAEITSANVKFFEIYGIGGFQICDFKTSLEEYSAIDVEKFTFKSIDEAVDKIKYFLANSAERYQIAEQQSKHFRENHTYEHRVEEILKKV
ncbi:MULTISPECIES: CgeB family protein [Chryseobacterium]|uniref:Spore maturation protein CgeB n=1 Tax=Chryseobacterium camelliae TaxID=1265445 RepID=A0ABU0TDU9_9FLAO|nr:MULTISPECIES: glycosyltransferase [Chryseobacterium]MDT3407087.1 spore maturation protein CgeB [Pseudacidovorax intermedius]MDQ1095121.1 spore maturation protein CgeB [Chryseobacterium camelliae]MDQ1099059.1 spore maturation protein CgeB [Chryseobacterium sp. SORGH_AS_1048]MDR6086408.1 spore maturation protein CgeB [Chryseobacterium sp. SORGH_AS_0909]MDR6130780.1 spore maturation protein CgeB [Chryseobacterium sp. SORGH_AS_1175]